MDRVTKLFKSKKPMTYRNVLFIDPGVRNMGFAFWRKLTRLAKPNPKKLILPSDSGLQSAPTNIHWLDAIDDHQAVWFEAYCDSHGVELVALECAELWGGSALSYASASKGDLFKLTTLIGDLRRIAIQTTGTKPLLVSPRLWKGTMPKEVMVRRVSRATKSVRRSPRWKAHEIDSVAMGFAAQGLL